MKISVFNLGCKVNQYECDVIREKLISKGYDVSQNLRKSDIYILNTCAVTAEAERKSRQAISRCLSLNPLAKIYVMGCASQKEPMSFKKNGVVFVGGVANKFSVIDYINQFSFTEKIDELPYKFEETSLSTPCRTRTYVKIQDGCNNFCSYCIIPYLRGRSRSKELKLVLSEVKNLSCKTNEIVLTGIDLMNYGKDIGISLSTLLNEISDIDVRIRLGSIYAEKIDEKLLDAMFALKKFCPHFHLSLQSGDYAVLKSMNRHYTPEEYFSKIQLIRSYDKYAAITTDVIVGYPTETDDAFEKTYKFIKDANFSDLHVFPFSPRSGTAASNMQSLPFNVVKHRRDILLEEKKRLHNDFLKLNVNRKHEVLIEESAGNFNIGYSRNYIRIYTKQNGEIVNALPTKIEKDGLKEE